MLSNFHSIVYTNHKLVQVYIKLDKAKPRMAGFWKFNMSLLNVKDFQDQLLLIIQWELAS